MPVRPPSLRSIAAFEAIARHNSFRKAAAELNLTTSALSHSVKALETRLNQQLFDRSPTGIRLTESGISLLARVRLSLGLLSDAFDIHPWQHKETLVVSALPSVARKIIIPNMRQLIAELPSVSFEIRATTAVESVESEVDVAVRFGPGGWRSVETSFVAGEQHILVASPDYWTGDLPDSPDALKSCHLIGDRESSWRRWLEGFGMSPDDFSSTLTITDSALAVDAAVEGLGVSLARAQLSRRELESGRLIRLFERALPAENSYWTVWSGSSPKRGVIHRFTAWLSGQFANLESERIAEK